MTRFSQETGVIFYFLKTDRVRLSGSLEVSHVGSRILVSEKVCDLFVGKARHVAN